MSTGIKRPREQTTDELPYGSDSERSNGRRDVRRRDDAGARDWRDAHLNANRERKPSYPGRTDDRSTERKDSSYRKDHRSLRAPASPRDRERRPPSDDYHNSDRAGVSLTASYSLIARLIIFLSSDRSSHQGSYRGKPYERERAPPYRKDEYRRDGIDRSGGPPTGPRSSRESKLPSREVSEGLSTGREEGE